MNNLKDYEEDIYKCSRCGLCQFVCPVFKASVNECAVSRGKFNMLNGVIKGELSLNRKIKSYLDLCTGCNACKDFCPSKINAKEIFIAAKAQYYKNNKISLKEKIVNSYVLFKTALCCAFIFFSVYRFLRMDKIIKKFEKYILKTGLPGKRLVLLNSLAHTQYNQRTTPHNKNNMQKAVYFEGCFNKYINKQTENAVKKILNNANIELIKKDFECCGVSYLNDGNIDAFIKIANINLEKIDCDFDYILTDCASCEEVLKTYKDYATLPNDQKVCEKTISVVDLIKKIKFVCNKNLKIAVHKPCHDDYDFIDIVKNIDGITYVEAEDFDKCCGFSGKFALQNSEISRKISKVKAQHYIEKNTDIILTTCPACILGLNQGLAEIQNSQKPEVMNLFVFLALYCTPTEY